MTYLPSSRRSNPSEVRGRLVQLRPNGPGVDLRPDYSAGPEPLDASWKAAGLTLAAIAVVFLRFTNMNEFGFNSDEAVYGGQAANLAGVEGFADKFSVFRAHPLLFQLTVSLFYRVEFIDVIGRYVAGLFGLATIVATYLVGRRLYDHRIGLLAAAFLAVTPYHVVVSRQALLESPMTLFFALSMWAYAHYHGVRTLRWSGAVGVLSGLTFLSKEAGVLALAVAFVVMTVEGGHKIRHFAAMAGMFVVTISPHLIASRLGGESKGGAGWADYVIWQTSRPSNHPPGFYLANMPHYFSLPLLLLVVIGLVLLLQRAQRDYRASLLVAWFLIPLLFFQVWKVKGYHYILPIVPAGTILAAVAIDRIRTSPVFRYPRQLATASVAVVLVVATLVSAVNGPFVQNHSRIGDAGYAGVPGAREAALWIKNNTREGSRILGIGPSIGNMIKFYGDRETLALSISPNPRRTNPAYEPVRNPDYMLRWGLVEYLVFDEYSASRTPHFANRLLDFIDRYGAEIVYEFRAPRVGVDGKTFDTPVIRIYRVAPVGSGGPLG